MRCIAGFRLYGYGDRAQAQFGGSRVLNRGVECKGPNGELEHRDKLITKLISCFGSIWNIQKELIGCLTARNEVGAKPGDLETSISTLRAILAAGLPRADQEGSGRKRSRR